MKAARTTATLRPRCSARPAATPTIRRRSGSRYNRRTALPVFGSTMSPYGLDDHVSAIGVPAISGTGDILLVRSSHVSWPVHSGEAPESARPANSGLDQGLRRRDLGPLSGHDLGMTNPPVDDAANESRAARPDEPQDTYSAAENSTAEFRTGETAMAPEAA